jgi:HK97 family phage prohead protease
MIKKFNTYETKNISLEVKDMDSVGRRVKIALAAFNNIDSDKDVIRKGAFSKSIQERGANTTTNRKIAFLRYHDWEHQIGKFVSLEETDTHLIAVADLGRSTKANDAFLDYQDGIIREHSIGFNYIPDKMQLHGEGEQAYFEIKEVILWEGSAVTFGANSLTPMLDVSKGNKQETLEKLNEEMKSLLYALKNGKGTDERLYSIEMGLKVCQQKYNSLINLESVDKTIQAIEKPIEHVEPIDVTAAQKQFYLNLLTKTK